MTFRMWVPVAEPPAPPNNAIAPVVKTVSSTIDACPPGVSRTTYFDGSAAEVNVELAIRTTFAAPPMVDAPKYPELVTRQWSQRAIDAVAALWEVLSTQGEAPPHPSIVAYSKSTCPLPWLLCRLYVNP